MTDQDQSQPGSAPAEAAVDVVGDYAVTPVPVGERRTLLNLFFVYSGVLAVVAAIFGGGVLGAGLAFGDMVIAVLIGAAVLAVIGSLTATVGGYTGCSTYVNMRYPFGRIGAWFAGFSLSPSRPGSDGSRSRRGCSASSRRSSSLSC